MMIDFAILVLAGLATAMFGLPMKHFRNWRWEHIWIGQALSSNILFPVVTAIAYWHVLADVIHATPITRLLIIFLSGAVWGLGGIGYGMSLVLLGLSFTYSVLFSITTLLGALIPIWVGWEQRSEHVDWFFLGLATCVIGTIVLGSAASRRDREGNGQEQNALLMPIPELPFAWTLLIALAGGVFSACMGLSMAANASLVNRALENGASQVLAPLVVWLPLNLGSATVALAYGSWCCSRSSSFKDLYQQHPIRNWGLVLLMGGLGFGGLLAYGFGESGKNHPAVNEAWAIFMASFILSGNVIGWFTGEWRNSNSQTVVRMIAGVVLLLSAIGFLAVR